MTTHKIVAAATLFLAAISVVSGVTILGAKKLWGVDTPANRPNIILILTDDQEAGSMAFMPHLQELLVNQGTTFKNFIFNVSLCCPSRASILRGQYAHNHQIMTNRPPNGGFERFRDLGHEQSTMATWLQGAGYRTAFFGKYLNGYPSDSKTYIPPGWDEWYAEVSGHYFDYELNENGQVVQYGNDPEDYETDVLARKAAEFIRHSAGEAPFFIYLAPFAPHGPLIPAPRHSNEFADHQAPRPPSFNEADVSDKPQWFRDLGLLSQSQIDDIDQRSRDRLRTLLGVDDLIKTIIDTLTAYGELDNTYLFYATDNGFHQGEHRLERGKNTAYEESIRVPLIVRGPGVPAAQRLEHLIANIDLASTFADMAGANVPLFVDGLSLVSFLGSPPYPIDSWRSVILVQHWQSDTGGGRNTRIPDYQGVRTPDYLFVEYATDELELYDLRNDPYQLESLHQTADPNLISGLATLLQELRNCAGAGCVIFGPVPVELVSFSATVLGSSVRLEWVTATESNNLGFDIERSQNGVDFRKIAFVAGNGTTAVPHRYAYADADLLAGRYYYRLRQIDVNGQFDYSQTIEVDVAAPEDFSLAQNYPNPFNPSTVINYQLSEVSDVELTIYNQLGQGVRTLINRRQPAGVYQAQWDGLDNTGKRIVSGVYLYRLKAGSFIQTGKMVLLE